MSKRDLPTKPIQVPRDERGQFTPKHKHTANKVGVCMVCGAKL